MTTTTNSRPGERSDGIEQSNARRWLYTVIAICFAGVAGYMFAYSLGIAFGGTAELSWVIVQLLGAVAMSALCVVFMRFAAQHTPKRPQVDPG